MGWLLAGGAATVALLVVVSPLGAGLGAPTTVSPPYPGTTVSQSTSWSQAGCGRGAVTSLAKWSPANGLASFGGSTAGKSACPSLGSVGGGGSGGVYGSWYVQMPLTLPNGAHSVQPNWTISYVAAERTSIVRGCPAVVLSSSGYGHSYCNVDSNFYFDFYTYLEDQTNFTYYGSTTYVPYTSNYSTQYNDTTCYSGTCYYSNSSYGSPASASALFGYTAYFNGTFNTSHHYVLYFNFYASTYASAHGYRSAVAFSMFNLRNGATPTRLNSIAIV